MAEKDTEERIYTIPLRKKWVKITRIRRGKKAINTIRNFLSRHLHSNNVKISKKLSESIFTRGIKKPPGKLKVKVKIEKDKVIAMLPEEIVKLAEPKKEEKVKEVKTEEIKPEKKEKIEKAKEIKS